MLNKKDDNLLSPVFLIVGLPLLGYLLQVKYAKKSFKGITIISRIYYFGPFSYL